MYPNGGTKHGFLLESRQTNTTLQTLIPENDRGFRFRLGGGIGIFEGFILSAQLSGMRGSVLTRLHGYKLLLSGFELVVITLV